MEEPPEKDAEEVAQNHGATQLTTFVLRKKGQQEIGWMWKRKPLQGYGHEIALSYRRKVLSDIESVLTDVGGEKLLQQFVDGCFGHLLRFVGGISCSKALHELISREIIVGGSRENELWFRIGETNIRFAPAEYALVTGLRFGSSSFDPLGTHEMPADGVFNRFCSGQPISIKALWNIFNEHRLKRQPEDYLKVAHVLALKLMALGYDPTKTVERWVWILVDDLDAWNKFPWGAYTYQALMYYVSMLPRKRDSLKRRYPFHGPVWALQIWAYEAIPRLGNASALVSGQVTVPRCLKWSFPRRNRKFPKQILEQKLHCYVKLEPTDEEKRQPYWLSVQTDQPLGVLYSSVQSRKQGRQGVPRRKGVATAASLSPPRPRCSSTHPPLVESSLGKPVNPVEVPDTDDSMLSALKPSARRSCRRIRTRASISSSLSSGGRPRHVRRLPELLDEERFANRVSSMVVDKMIKPMAVEVTQILVESMLKLLLPHLKQHIRDLFQARELDDETEILGDCAGADEKKETEKSFDGGSSSLHNSRHERVDEPSPGLSNKPALQDAFGSEEQCEVPMNDPRSDVGVAGNGKSFANQEDSATPNEDSRLKRDGPIRAQSDSTEKAEIKPPRAGEAHVPELLACPSSSKTKKKKSSSRSKHRRRSPSSSEETGDDEGSESSSGDERRRRTKRGKRRKRKRSESSSSESSDCDRHWRRRNKRKHRRASSSEPDAQGNGRRHCHRRRPHRHRSVSSSD